MEWPSQSQEQEQVFRGIGKKIKLNLRFFIVSLGEGPLIEKSFCALLLVLLFYF